MWFPFTNGKVRLVTHDASLFGRRLKSYTNDKREWPQYEFLIGMAFEQAILCVRTIIQMQLTKKAQLY